MKTHTVKVTNVHKGVNRQMFLSNYTDENGEKFYFIRLLTTWPDGEENETKIKFGQYGFEMFCTFMNFAPLELEKYTDK